MMEQLIKAELLEPQSIPATTSGLRTKNCASCQCEGDNIYIAYQLEDSELLSFVDSVSCS